MTIQSNLEKDFEINAAREFELHLLRYQELKRIEYRAGEDAASHQGILRNLAKLFPQLRDQFNLVLLANQEHRVRQLSKLRVRRPRTSTKLHREVLRQFVKFSAPMTENGSPLLRFMKCLFKLDY